MGPPSLRRIIFITFGWIQSFCTCSGKRLNPWCFAAVWGLQRPQSSRRGSSPWVIASSLKNTTYILLLFSGLRIWRAGVLRPSQMSTGANKPRESSGHTPATTYPKHSRNGWVTKKLYQFPHYSLLMKVTVGANADINQVEEDGFTPLCIAASQGHTGVVQTLIRESRCCVQ